MTYSVLFVVVGALALLPLLYLFGFGLTLLWGASLPSRANACCSFCHKNHRTVGPLVEGPGDVYICRKCCELSLEIIELERERKANLATKS